MSSMKVALLQMMPCGDDQQANLAKGEEFCRRASELGADITLFPEMWNIGYTSYDSGPEGARESWLASAITRDDGFVLHFQKLAQDLGMPLH